MNRLTNLANSHSLLNVATRKSGSNGNRLKNILLDNNNNNNKNLHNNNNHFKSSSSSTLINYQRSLHINNNNNSNNINLNINNNNNNNNFNTNSNKLYSVSHLNSHTPISNKNTLYHFIYYHYRSNSNNDNSIATKRYSSTSSSGNNSSSNSNNNNNENKQLNENNKQENQDKPKDESILNLKGKRLFFKKDKGIFLLYKNISERIRFVLTRHKPLTSDHFFAIFSWLLFGTGSLIILGTTTLVSLILWIVNTFEFSEWTAKRIGKYLTTNTGINITFEHARGELKTGYIRLENVTVSRNPRADEHLSSIQLSIKQIDIKLSILWLLEGKGIIQECLVSGVRGIIDRRSEGLYLNYADMIYPRKKKALGDFVFDRLEVKDLLITYHMPDKTHRPLSISVFSMESDKFRKQWILYDLLSSKNIVGKFDGSLFTYTIPQHQTADTNASKFEQRELKLDGVNIDILSRNATGPLGWIKEGTFDIQLNLLLPKVKEGEILESESHTVDYGIIPIDKDPLKNLHLTFSVQLNHLFSVAPLYTPELSYLSNALAHPIVAYINSHSKHIPLQFNFSMNLRQYNGAWTLSQASFWELLSDSVGRELANKVQQTKNVTTLKEIAGQLFSEVMDWLLPFIEKNKQEYQRLIEEQHALQQNENGLDDNNNDQDYFKQNHHCDSVSDSQNKKEE
ncbi:hypothetical protein PPL_05071 [Heterostelium album PN500]|uniref:Uncharacterized protein n=1 Tax=Heterostelium pallidum (strain ATCC 26659 / Pp 5 / PN500) TaxID=670386 RepID=D3B9C7_HETP5|nr:hypothetical protein PPL_05071 [Heterostelium album PN500]EFA81839.1 hypothetical protein PPL_05071 [Heterostelium album PN500]|eukprot:XP_020433956.1 hypothetical protein PPL_05071 [Heterostelium album PN500]